MSRAAAKREKNDWTNIERFGPQDQVKFVVADRGDYEFARGVIARFGLASRCAALLISPMYGALEPNVLAGWILADRLAVRLQLQLHKYRLVPFDQGRLTCARLSF